VPRFPAAKVREAIAAYQEQAGTLIALVKSHRDVLATYTETFDRMQTRIETSLEGAWQIFGRVLARQSVVQMNVELRDMGSSFSRQRLSGEHLETPTEQLAVATMMFATTLASNEKALRRSPGAPWFEAMHADLQQLTATRDSLLKMEKQIHDLGDALAKAPAELATLIPRELRIQIAAPAQSAGRRAAVKAPARVSEPAAETLAVSVVPPDVPSAAAPEHTRQPPAGKAASTRPVVAWISAIVLALLTYISIATVVSVVQPVRRLLRSMTTLAKGGTCAPLPRGGIHELDKLAVAFNVMAERLAEAQAVAQDSNVRLEALVDERTRQFQQLAAHDPLTGLPNRRQLFALLHDAIARAGNANRLVGVLFLDIDNFKNINDSIGHAFGDRVLVSIAQRLDGLAKSFGFAARLGGDEFTLVYPDAENLADIHRAGEGVVQAFQKPLEVDGREIIVSVSLGVSVFPDQEQDGEALLRAADAALFRAKALGRSQMAVFTPDLVVAASSKFSIEQGLRLALQRNEFELVFQPEIDAETLEVSLVEALIRWRMPDGRHVLPGEFLAIAEESGLIVEISDWVLRAAIESAANWYRGSWPEVRIAVNVSSRQFLDYRFVERLQELLREFELPSSCIEIELTESVLQTGPATIDTLEKLRAIGVAIALDDFGTGYSSLASIEKLPLTRIKLDRSLIASIDTSPRSAVIARSIISLCQGLGLAITAEGIERAEQFDILVGYPAMYMQGYLLSRPVSRDSLIGLMPGITRQCEDLVLQRKARPPSAGPHLPAAVAVSGPENQLAAQG